MTYKTKIICIIATAIVAVTALTLGIYFGVKTKKQTTSITPTASVQSMATTESAPLLSMSVIKESGIMLSPLKEPVQTRGAGNSITASITATVIPTTARNKLVDWSVEWAESGVSGNINSYVTVTPEFDGSTNATIACYQPFSNNIVVVVTTRESGYTAECLLTYVGIPTIMSVTSSDATIDGDTITVGVGNNYDMTVALSNVLGAAGSNYQDVNVILGATGNLLLGNYEKRSDGNSFWHDGETQTVTLDSLKDNFIEVAKTGSTITITTKKSIESYYEYATRMDGGRHVIYTNKVKETVGDCYFTVLIVEPNSHLSKTIKVRFDTGLVTGVNTNRSTIQF